MMSNTENDRSCLGELKDTNLNIRPGDTYYSCIEELGLDESWKDKLVLSIGDVKELWKKVKLHNQASNNEHKKYYIHEVLSDSNVTIPCLEVPPRNPELEKRITALRNQLNEQEYQRMTRNVNASSPYKSHPEDAIGYQLKQLNSGIIASVQFVISLAAAFLFGFMGIQIFTGPMELAMRLLLGIASAVIVGVAELYILVVHLDADEIRREEINKKVK